MDWMEIEPDVEEFLENSPTVELLRVSGGDPGEQPHGGAAAAVPLGLVLLTRVALLSQLH